MDRPDDSGYPFHCKAKEIDNGARIMAVVDIFTAISEDRPYRKGIIKDEINRIFNGQAEKGFIDRRLVELLFDNYETIGLDNKTTI